MRNTCAELLSEIDSRLDILIDIVGSRTSPEDVPFTHEIAVGVLVILEDIKRDIKKAEEIDLKNNNELYIFRKKQA